MSEDQPYRSEAKSEADQTLLGVAPPRIESSTETLSRSPVMVRSGTSSADGDLPPPSQALHGLPPRNMSSAEIPVALVTKKSKPNAASEGALRFLRAHLVVPMVLAPVLIALILVALGHHKSSGMRPAAPATANPPVDYTAETQKAVEKPGQFGVSDLEGRSPDSLSSHELLLLAQVHAQKQSDAASQLRQRVEANAALGKDSATQIELLHEAADPRTARDALGAMAAVEPPIGADLLYEVWAGTTERSDTTELARTLLYSTNLRGTASPALSVALELRSAETCEQFKALLPKALKEGDRRSLHPLTKLNSKRGCGAKKADDCYACLRDQKDELTATINATKSRRPPSYAAQ